MSNDFDPLLVPIPFWPGGKAPPTQTRCFSKPLLETRNNNMSNILVNAEGYFNRPGVANRMLLVGCEWMDKIEISVSLQGLRTDRPPLRLRV